MIGYEGCEAACPAVLFARAKQDVLDAQLGELDASGVIREAERKYWGEIIVADYANTGNVAPPLSRRADIHEAFSDLAARNDEYTREDTEHRITSLNGTVGVREAACPGRTPCFKRTLGFIGTKQLVCGSTVTDDGLPNRSKPNRSK
jgi:hypothetical protein